MLIEMCVDPDRLCVVVKASCNFSYPSKMAQPKVLMNHVFRNYLAQILNYEYEIRLVVKFSRCPEWSYAHMKALTLEHAAGLEVLRKSYLHEGRADVNEGGGK